MGSVAVGAMVVGTSMLVVFALAMATLFMLTLGIFCEPIFAALDGAVEYARIVFGGAVTVWLMFGLSA